MNSFFENSLALALDSAPWLLFGLLAAGLLLVRRELGGRALAAYLFGVGGVSILLDLVLDAVLSAGRMDIRASLAQVGKTGGELPVTLSMSCLLILVVMAIRPLRHYLVQGKVKEDGSCCG